MKIGDLVKDYDGVTGVVLTAPRLSYDCDRYVYEHGLMEGDRYEVVTICMPWGEEQYATDEIEVISESR